jgi:DegV family protein with EDD domain
VTIHLVTDSTSDIEQERAAEHGITVVPLTVDFGGQTYRDGIDLDNKAFYAKLASSSVLPKTSTPSVEAFRAAYEKAIADGATAILSVHISGALSGTLNTATLAANQLTEERERAKKAAVPIRLIDSRSVSAGFGYPVLLAAERAKAGASLDDLAAFVLRISEGSKTLFLLDTLEYLQKGGRIGAAQAVIGTMLSIKPILGLRDGVVVPVERVRTRGKALARMGELVRAIGPIEYMALAASDDGAAADLLTIVKPIYTGHVEMFKLGAVVGTHAGPHAAGLFVMPQQG